MSKQKNKGRIEYIDALRGFTMILVVFAHVETYMLEIEPNSTFVSSLFISFRMPLFFFISGYIAYKKDVQWDFAYYSRNIAKKLRIQLIPTFFFGLLYTYLFSIGNFSDFVINYHKFGYWFTLCLLGMFVILYTSNLLCYIFRRGRKWLFLMLGGMMFLSYMYRYFYETHPTIVLVSDIFCLHQICVYLPFFIMGYIVSEYKMLFHRFLSNQINYAVIFILFSVAFYVKYTLPTSIYERSVILLIYRVFQEYIIGILGICCIYNFFRIKSLFMSKKTKIGELLQYIGKRTLDIYMLHYFFLSMIPNIGPYINSNPNILLELLIGMGLSLFIIACCLIVSKTLRMSNYLSYFLFGVKNNSYA